MPLSSPNFLDFLRALLRPCADIPVVHTNFITPNFRRSAMADEDQKGQPLPFALMMMLGVIVLGMLLLALKLVGLF